MTAAAELGQVEEEVNTENANTPAAFQRAATSILGRPNIGVPARTTTIFGRGSHAGFVQGQRNALARFTAPINQAQLEDPFEGSVHSFDNMLNTRDFGARFLQLHVAEGIGPAAGGTFPLLDQAWTGFSSSAQYPENAHNLTRVDYMQASHIQEVVSQNESSSYYLEDGAAACPPESDAAAHLDQARLHLLATDNAVKLRSTFLQPSGSTEERRKQSSTCRTSKIGRTT